MPPLLEDAASCIKANVVRRDSSDCDNDSTDTAVVLLGRMLIPLRMSSSSLKAPRLHTRENVKPLFCRT